MAEEACAAVWERRSYTGTESYFAEMAPAGLRTAANRPPAAAVSAVNAGLYRR